MSDLINRDSVLEVLYEIKDSPDIPINYGTILDLVRQIREMPTAYDVGNVVRQLEKISYNYLSGYPHCSEYDYGVEIGAKSALSSAVYIIKNGGVK